MKDQNDRGDEHDSGAGEQRGTLKGTGEKEAAARIRGVVPMGRSSLGQMRENSRKMLTGTGRLDSEERCVGSTCD